MMMIFPPTIDIAASRERARQTREQSVEHIVDAACVAKGLDASAVGFRATARAAAARFTCINAIMLNQRLQNHAEYLVEALVWDPKMEPHKLARYEARVEAAYAATDELDKVDFSALPGFLAPPKISRDTDDDGRTLWDETDPDDPKLAPMVIAPETITRESLLAMVDDPDIGYNIDASDEDAVVLDAFLAETKLWKYV